MPPLSNIQAQLECLRWHRLAPGETTSPLLNRLKVEHAFGDLSHTPPAQLRLLKQVHGTCLAEASSSEKGAATPEADGWFTSRQLAAEEPAKTPAPGASAGPHLAVSTADCLPVILTGRTTHKEGYAVVHAGWRGLSAGILTSALGCFEQAGMPPDQLTCALGPCISAPAFQVGPELITAFGQPGFGLSETELAWVFHKDQSLQADRFNLDLQLAAALHLIRQGVRASQIEILRHCTHAEARFQSYRREGTARPANLTWVAAL